MIRAVLILLMGLAVPMLAPVALPAQEFRALARVNWADSHLVDAGNGVELRLALSQAVPWRAFTLAAPGRLVLDFRELAFDGLAPGFDATDAVAAVRPLAFRPGWSRLVLDLDQRLVIEQAGMQTDGGTGAAVLTLRLRRTDRGTFAAAAGAPPSAQFDLPEAMPARADPRLRQDGRGPLHVVLDPGHGGVDPGAVRGAHTEAELTLAFAREFAEVLLRSGRFEVTLTRDGDLFVPLPTRVTIARTAGADLFISLHADALPEGRAHGATVYTLAAEASDAATARLAERMSRADILAGVDLAGSDDTVAGVLMDLAWQDTAPRADRLAEALVDGIAAARGELHPTPRLEADFAVLRAADIPSVLVELGFMSSPRDLQNLLDPDWRARMQAGMRDAILDWALHDAAEAELLRQ